MGRDRRRARDRRLRLLGAGRQGRRRDHRCFRQGAGRQGPRQGHRDRGGRQGEAQPRRGRQQGYRRRQRGQGKVHLRRGRRRHRRGHQGRADRRVSGFSRSPKKRMLAHPLFFVPGVPGARPLCALQSGLSVIYCSHPPRTHAKGVQTDERFSFLLPVFADHPALLGDHRALHDLFPLHGPAGRAGALSGDLAADRLRLYHEGERDDALQPLAQASGADHDALRLRVQYHDRICFRQCVFLAEGDAGGALSAGRTDPADRHRDHFRLHARPRYPRRGRASARGLCRPSDPRRGRQHGDAARLYREGFDRARHAQQHPGGVSERSALRDGAARRNGDPGHAGRFRKRKGRGGRRGHGLPRRRQADRVRRLRHDLPQLPRAGALCGRLRAPRRKNARFRKNRAFLFMPISRRRRWCRPARRRAPGLLRPEGA